MATWIWVYISSGNGHQASKFQIECTCLSGKWIVKITCPNVLFPYLKYIKPMQLMWKSEIRSHPSDKSCRYSICQTVILLVSDDRMSEISKPGHVAWWHQAITWPNVDISTFWFVDVLVVDVSVCRRFDQLPISVKKPSLTDSVVKSGHVPPTHHPCVDKAADDPVRKLTRHYTGP